MSKSVNLSLDYEPRDWQRMCHINKARFTVLALHRRAGKTELALMELLDCAMSCKQDLGAFFYVAPQLKQAKAIAWNRLKQRVEGLVAQGSGRARQSVSRAQDEDDEGFESQFGGRKSVAVIKAGEGLVPVTPWRSGESPPSLPSLYYAVAVELLIISHLVSNRS